MGSVGGSQQPWLAWMRRALQLASLAEGRTSPNPLVGAVVLDADGRLVGEGFHARAGEPHAEPVALAQAGDAARGGTIIVTLEPCCHHGRTPPCTEAILAAGVRRVVVALTDPDPRVAGGGLQRLRDAGLEVISGVLAADAAHQNRAFIHRVQTGRPWGVLKWAMSLDGRTALPNGASQWISGPPARAWVHGLRAQCDAVIVGGGTVRADDPLLTSRGGDPPNRCAWCSAAALICRLTLRSGISRWPAACWPIRSKSSQRCPLSCALWFRRKGWRCKRSMLRNRSYC